MTQVNKNDLANLCIDCHAPCCNDLVMLITKPQNKTEINELKWYLHFDTVDICIRNYRWHILIKGRCIFLGKNNMCTNYEERTDRCRKHQSHECEIHDQWYDIKLTTPKDLDKYLESKKKKSDTTKM